MPLKQRHDEAQRNAPDIFKGRHLILSPKSLHNFKLRIRELTNRTWGVSWRYRYFKLKQYVVGWMNYFALVTFGPVERLNHWI
ncbi:MAG TPA: hypothetical protein ENI98_03425 [Gammaproteobacteria bacterium]|nr:hypothetical protein [Gammaproteobacteria bacterium]